MADNITNKEYKRLAEAVLFVSGKAMTTEQIASAIGVSSIGHVDKLLEELILDYQKTEGSLTVLKTGNKYLMGLKEPYATKLSGLAGKPDISKGALRVLAYISKNEPIMQSEIVKSFGASTYDYIAELLEKEFITSKKAGRTKKIGITPKFMEYFDVK